jgi:hypothetical protein
VLVALAILAVDSLLDRLGVATGTHTTVIAFLVIAGVTIAVGLLGHATIVRIQTWFTWAFALLTVEFIALELPQVQWGKLADLPSGSWLTGFLPATSIVMAGLGISWANAERVARWIGPPEGAGGQSRGGGGLAGRGGRGPRADHLDDQGLHLARLVGQGPVRRVEPGAAGGVRGGRPSLRPVGHPHRPPHPGSRPALARS